MRDQEPLHKTEMPGYYHLVCFAIGYGVLIAIFMVIAEQSDDPRTGMFPVMIVAAGLVSSIVLTGMWSVFGPGSYLRRLVVAHLIGLIPAVGFAFGTLVIFSNNVGFSLQDLLFGGLASLISIPVVSLAAQLPFLFFRIFFGWQIVAEGTEPKQAYALKDIFVITFVFALCFAVPRVSMNLTNLGSPYSVSSYQDYDEQGNPIRVSSEEREIQERRYRQRTLAVYYTSYFASSVVVFVFTAIGMPLLLIVFWSKETLTGCMGIVTYVMALAILFVFVFAVFTGFPSGVSEPVFYLLMMLALIACAIFVPAFVSKRCGFRLTSKKWHEREMQLKFDAKKVNTSV